MLRITKGRNTFTAHIKPYAGNYTVKIMSNREVNLNPAWNNDVYTLENAIKEGYKQIRRNYENWKTCTG